MSDQLDSPEKTLHSLRSRAVHLVLVLLAASSFMHAQDDVSPSPPTAISGPVSVGVDINKEAKNFLAPRALGVQGSLYDPDMLKPESAELLKAAGILTLRYPGGNAADNSHWSTYNKYDGRHPVDFGSFAKLTDKIGGTMVLSVNYGSNLKNDGPGEPAEAAAWVAYANGKPGDPKVIGADSAGNDWKTVGYWAEMRSSAPLQDDDGYNFLRIAHPQQLNVKYWEVGNEIYTNGYFEKDNGGTENDHHAPYSEDSKRNAGLRAKNEKLGPAVYGENAVKFAKAMKAVDPRISVGVVLSPTTAGPSYADWNAAVLKGCAAEIDFVSLHWYADYYAPPDWKSQDNVRLLVSTTTDLQPMITGLIDEMRLAPGGKMLQLAVTELGVHPWLHGADSTAMGLFAADAYASLAEDGAVNIDWAELHGGSLVTQKDDKPQPAYFGIEMMHKMMNMRDIFVTAKSSNSLLSVHAAKRADGSVGLMFVNKDPKNAATVKVKINGENLAKAGSRYDWGATSAQSGHEVQQSQVESLGNSFTITVSAYTVTDLVIPIAK
jgi:alpha-L-arabinofuranosidase